MSCLFLCVFVMLNLRVLSLAPQVRHMSLSELGATDEMLKVSASAVCPTHHPGGSAPANCYPRHCVAVWFAPGPDNCSEVLSFLHSLRFLQTTDFDMDYFNKSFVPLDVDGNPILSRAKQEELALERDLEAAGFAAAAKPSHHSGGTTSSKRVSFPTRDEGDPSYEVPLLPVDKGIFRRKGAPPGATQQSGDEEQGLSGEFPWLFAPCSV
jgi:hypothetical protein